jgi:hypothetical protein
MMMMMMMMMMSKRKRVVCLLKEQKERNFWGRLYESQEQDFHAAAGCLKNRKNVVNAKSSFSFSQ